MGADCLFCRIVRGEIPATLVAQNEHCVAFRDINPQAPIHVLVIPREHIASLNDAKDPAAIGESLKAKGAVVDDLDERIGQIRTSLLLSTLF